MPPLGEMEGWKIRCAQSQLLRHKSRPSSSNGSARERIFSSIDCAIIKKAKVRGPPMILK